MTVSNIFTLFSESTNGTPIIVSTTTSPGTLIHTTTTELDAIWLSVSMNDVVAYTDAVYIRVIKGVSGNYVQSGVFKLLNNKKTPIETGLIITSNVEYRIYIDASASSVTPNLAVEGYVHRRI